MTFCIVSLIYASMLMSLAITANANIRPWVYIALSILMLFLIVMMCLAEYDVETRIDNLEKEIKKLKEEIKNGSIKRN